MRGVVLVTCLCSLVATAQTALVAPYPLDVLVRGTDAAKIEELQAASNRLLANAGVTVQPRLTIKAALERLKRQDCATEDDCLRQLAILSNGLYGIYVSVEATSKTVTVTGRVVRDDGKRVSGPEKVVEERKAGEAFDVVAKRALPKLFVALKLATLPAVREAPVKVDEPVKAVEPVEPVKPPVVDAGVPDAGVQELPPPPPPPVVESPLRSVGLVTAISGAAVAVGGGALILVGRGQAATVLTPEGALKAGSTATDAMTARSATALQTAGAIVGVVGLAAGATGLVLWLTSGPAEPAKTTLSVAPMQGGAAVFVTGELP